LEINRVAAPVSSQERASGRRGVRSNEEVGKDIRPVAATLSISLESLAGMEGGLARNIRDDPPEVDDCVVAVCRGRECGGKSEYITVLIKGSCDAESERNCCTGQEAQTGSRSKRSKMMLESTITMR
jgi:hypothetical protein